MKNLKILICPWCNEENEHIESIWQTISSEIKIRCKTCGKKSIHTPLGIAKVYGSKSQQLFCTIFSWIIFLLIILIVTLFFVDSNSQALRITYIVTALLIPTWIIVTGKITGVTPGRASTYRDINKAQFNIAISIFSLIAVVTGLISIVLVSRWL